MYKGNNHSRFLERKHERLSILAFINVHQKCLPNYGDTLNYRLAKNAASSQHHCLNECMSVLTTPHQVFQAPV